LTGGAQAALLAVASTAIDAVSLTLIKLAGPTISGWQVAFNTFFVGLLVLIPYALARGHRIIPRRFVWLHLLRGALGITSLAAFYISLAGMKMPDAVAFNFATPLFVLVLAVLFLGEKVGWRRWSATLVGFIGVVVMVRPSPDMEPVVLWALLCCITAAAGLICMKFLTAHETSVTLAITLGGIALVFGAIPAFLSWQWLSAGQWALLIGGALVNLASQQCMLTAFAKSDASSIAPLTYLRLVFAGIVAAIVFGEFPDLWTLAGASIIIGSTAYIARREARRRREAASRL
jgi:drug/metabolite transporter (DMT)-like permease